MNKIKINPRYVKEENGLRPFQRETLEAIKDSDVKLIFVEAPMGDVSNHLSR